MPTIMIDHEDEETISLFLDYGEGFTELAHANHDEHGWSVVDLVDQMGRELSRITGWPLIEK